MPVQLSDKAVRLIEARNFGFLAVQLPDGSPMVTPVWVDHDGDLILVNTAMGRVKQKQAARGRHVSIAIADTNNMYERITIQGRVLEQTNVGADAHIDKLANKYTGAKKYERSSPNEKRVIIKIEPVRII